MAGTEDFRTLALVTSDGQSSDALVVTLMTIEGCEGIRRTVSHLPESLALVSVPLDRDR